MGWYSWKWNVSLKECNLYQLGCLVLCCVRQVDSEKVSNNLVAREVEDKVSERTSRWILLLIAYLFAQHLSYCLVVFQRGKISATLKDSVIYTYHIISLGIKVSMQKLLLWLLLFIVFFFPVSRKYQELAECTCQKFSGFLHRQNT